MNTHPSTPTPARRALTVAALALSALAGGCMGLIGEPSGVAAGDGGVRVEADGRVIGPGGDGGAALACEVIQPGTAPLRRLTRLEYNNTVRDLLRTSLAPADEFAPDNQLLGFDNNATVQTVSPTLAEQYLDAADRLAAEAITDLPRLLGCTPATTGEDACARRFLESFLPRAFRRPLAGEELARWQGFYAEQKTRHGFANAVAQVTRTVLVSPDFLYRAEFGRAGAVAGAPAVARLTSYEMATRLSYLLWRTMPDATLAAAAAADQLTSAAQVAAQARRLLADARADRAVQDFAAQWLWLGRLAAVERDAAHFPGWRPEVVGLLRTETQRFVAEVVLRGDARLATLLTADFTYLNRPLAQYYGVTPLPAGDAFERVTVDPRRHGGVLTHAGVMLGLAHPEQTHPVERGMFVRSQMLCAPPPPPPNDLMIMPPEIRAGATTRERWAEHSSNPTCAGCHRLLDPVGFGFENFDPTGRWRDTEEGMTVDASGELVGTRDVDGRFQGAAELAGRLARSAQVRECVVTQWFRYAHGRAEVTADACTLRQLNAAFEASGGNVRELLVALTQTEAFLYRPADDAAGATGGM